MAKRNGSKASKPAKKTRRQFDKSFKQQAVQMMLDGHSASSVSDNLGIDNTNLLYRWKGEVLRDGGQAAVTLDSRVRELEEQLRRVERERDILKKRWPFSAAMRNGGVHRHCFLGKRGC